LWELVERHNFEANSWATRDLSGKHTYEMMWISRDEFMNGNNSTGSEKPGKTTSLLTVFMMIDYQI
jgi:hypothetical protein